MHAAEAGEVGQPAGQLLERRVDCFGVLAEHLGLLADLAAGGDREVGEAALGRGPSTVHAGAREVLREHLRGHARAHARRVQQRQRSVRLGGQRGSRRARLLAAAIGQAEVAGVAGRLTVAQEPDLGHRRASLAHGWATLGLRGEGRHAAAL